MDCRISLQPSENVRGGMGESLPVIPTYRYPVRSSPGGTKQHNSAYALLFLTLLFAAGPTQVRLHSQLQEEVLGSHIAVWKEARWKERFIKEKLH